MSAPWSCWGLVPTGPSCTEKPRTTSAAVSGARWAMHQRSTPLPVICLPAVPLKSWQSTSRSLRLLVMGEKMFLFSLMFSRSSPRPYRCATRRQGQSPRCWSMSGFSATGYPTKSTVTRVGTLSLSWWNPCVSSMAPRRPGPLHAIPMATRSASDSIACCMICFEPCPRNRNPSGHSTSRSLCRRITIHLTLPPGFRPTSFCSARNRSYQLTTCLGAQPRPRLDRPTGYDSIGCACRLHTRGHWNISKKLQQRDESRRTRKLPITHYTLVTGFYGRLFVYCCGRCSCVHLRGETVSSYSCISYWCK